MLMAKSDNFTEWLENLLLTWTQYLSQTVYWPPIDSQEIKQVSAIEKSSILAYLISDLKLPTDEPLDGNLEHLIFEKLEKILSTSIIPHITDRELNLISVVIAYIKVLTSAMTSRPNIMNHLLEKASKHEENIITTLLNVLETPDILNQENIYTRDESVQLVLEFLTLISSNPEMGLTIVNEHAPKILQALFLTSKDEIIDARAFFATNNQSLRIDSNSTFQQLYDLAPLVVDVLREKVLKTLESAKVEVKYLMQLFQDYRKEQGHHRPWAASECLKYFHKQTIVKLEALLDQIIFNLEETHKFQLKTLQAVYSLKDDEECNILNDLFQLYEDIHFLCIGIEPKLLTSLGKTFRLRLTEDELDLPIFNELTARIKRSINDLANQTSLTQCKSFEEFTINSYLQRQIFFSFGNYYNLYGKTGFIQKDWSEVISLTIHMGLLIQKQTISLAAQVLINSKEQKLLPPLKEDTLGFLQVADNQLASFEPLLLSILKIQYEMDKFTRVHFDQAKCLLSIAPAKFLVNITSFGVICDDSEQEAAFSNLKTIGQELASVSQGLVIDFTIANPEQMLQEICANDAILRMINIFADSFYNLDLLSVVFIAQSGVLPLCKLYKSLITLELKSRDLNSTSSTTQIIKCLVYAHRCIIQSLLKSLIQSVTHGSFNGLRMPKLSETTDGLYLNVRHLMMNLYAHMAELLLDWSETTLTQQSLLQCPRSEDESLNDDTLCALLNVLLDKSWRNLPEEEEFQTSFTGKKGKKGKKKKAKKAKKQKANKSKKKGQKAKKAKKGGGVRHQYMDGNYGLVARSDSPDESVQRREVTNEQVQQFTELAGNTDTQFAVSAIEMANFDLEKAVEILLQNQQGLELFMQRANEIKDLRQIKNIYFEAEFNEKLASYIKNVLINLIISIKTDKSQQFCHLDVLEFVQQIPSIYLRKGQVFETVFERFMTSCEKTQCEFDYCIQLLIFVKEACEIILDDEKIMKLINVGRTLLENKLFNQVAKLCIILLNITSSDEFKNSKQLPEVTEFYLKILESPETHQDTQKMVVLAIYDIINSTLQDQAQIIALKCLQRIFSVNQISQFEVMKQIKRIALCSVNSTASMLEKVLETYFIDLSKIKNQQTQDLAKGRISILVQDFNLNSKDITFRLDEVVEILFQIVPSFSMIKTVLKKNCIFEKVDEGLIIRNNISFVESRADCDLLESEKWFSSFVDSNESEAFRIVLQEVKSEKKLDSLRLLAQMTQIHPHLICLFLASDFTFDDFSKWIVTIIAENFKITQSFQKPLNDTISGILTTLLGINSKMSSQEIQIKIYLKHRVIDEAVSSIQATDLEIEKLLASLCIIQILSREVNIFEQNRVLIENRFYRETIQYLLEKTEFIFKIKKVLEVYSTEKNKIWYTHFVDMCLQCLQCIYEFNDFCQFDGETWYDYLQKRISEIRSFEEKYGPKNQADDENDIIRAPYTNHYSEENDRITDLNQHELEAQALMQFVHTNEGNYLQQFRENQDILPQSISEVVSFLEQLSYNRLIEKFKVLAQIPNHTLRMFFDQSVEKFKQEETRPNSTLFQAIAIDFKPFVDPKTCDKDLEYSNFGELTLRQRQRIRQRVNAEPVQRIYQEFRVNYAFKDSEKMPIADVKSQITQWVEENYFEKPPLITEEQKVEFGAAEDIQTEQEQIPAEESKQIEKVKQPEPENKKLENQLQLIEPDMACFLVCLFDQQRSDTPLLKLDITPDFIQVLLQILLKVKEFKPSQPINLLNIINRILKTTDITIIAAVLEQLFKHYESQTDTVQSLFIISCIRIIVQNNPSIKQVLLEDFFVGQFEIPKLVQSAFNQIKQQQTDVKRALFNLLDDIFNNATIIQVSSQTVNEQAISLILDSSFTQTEFKTESMHEYISKLASSADCVWSLVKLLYGKYQTNTYSKVIQSLMDIIYDQTEVEDIELPALTLKRSITNMINDEPTLARKKTLANQTSTLSEEVILKMNNILSQSEQPLDTLLFLVKFTNKMKLQFELSDQVEKLNEVDLIWCKQNIAQHTKALNQVLSIFSQKLAREQILLLCKHILCLISYNQNELEKFKKIQTLQERFPIKIQPIVKTDFSEKSKMQKVLFKNAQISEYLLDLGKFLLINRDFINSKLLRTNEGQSLLLCLRSKVPDVLSFELKREHLMESIQKLKKQSEDFECLNLEIHRENIYQDSFNQIADISIEQLKHRISVRFVDEEGIDGGGLRRDFFTQLSQAIFEKETELFCLTSNNATFHPNVASGVNNSEHLKHFKFVGRFIGKAIYDGELINIHLSRPIYRMMIGEDLIFEDLIEFDKQSYQSCVAILECEDASVLGLNFTLNEVIGDQTTTIELVEGGAQIDLTNENKIEYLEKVVQYKLFGAVKHQIEALLEGFHEMIPYNLIDYFQVLDLELAISGYSKVDLDDLKKSTKYYGYTEQSIQIKWLWITLETVSDEFMCKFLAFVTGCSRVPPGGFSSPGQHLTISNYGDQNHFPQTHTCSRTLDLPQYKTEEILREKLIYSLSESEGFGFA